MPIFFALLILGLIQGLTEFLPVSSSGHLVLFSRIFGIEESLFVSIILHVATLLSIIVVFRKKIWYYLRHPFCDECKKLVVATIPTCLIVLILMPLINESFQGGFLPICFMLTALLLTATSLFFTKNEKKASYIKEEIHSNISYMQAIIMGVFQGLAIFPGISRSGSTICGGIISGGNRESVAEFSFLMSIPIILLSLVKEIYELVLNNKVLSINIPGLIFSSLIAFIVGVFSIRFMIKLTKKVNFIWFSLYLIFISILSFFILF